MPFTDGATTSVRGKIMSARGDIARDSDKGRLYQRVLWQSATLYHQNAQLLGRRAGPAAAAIGLSIDRTCRQAMTGLP
ncbi:hypothetical protein XI04_33695 [Bradyrhizobium sp. CCBAU 11430]|nr:hypothetical protein [Bradyrhizobium sp. CCBAU 21360]MDA9517965.1 hypothetical protein [Bradyrhizobium sp. CCBAU 11430]